MPPEESKDQTHEGQLTPDHLSEQPDLPAPDQVISPSPANEAALSGRTDNPDTAAPSQLPQDNHKILNDFGSPAFPTPVSTVSPEPKKSRKKLIAILAIILVILLAGSAAAYFGYVVPNKPENLWRSALQNSGRGYDGLVTYSEKTEKIKDWTQVGKFKVGGDIAFDGTFEGKSSGVTSQLTGHVSAVGLRVGVDLRTLPSATSTPDVYFKADGLQGLGALIGSEDPHITAAVNGINNQWYVIDHTFFDQFGASPSDKMNFTNKDVTDFVKTAGATTKKYVFTNDSSQSVVVLKEKIGKEKRDGQNVYHYKVGLDKARTKAYLTALCSDLKGSKLGEAADLKDYKCSEFAKSADQLEDSDRADAWVNTSTRLVQAIRFSETKNARN
jgi:hypothetical protein